MKAWIVGLVILIAGCGVVYLVGDPKLEKGNASAARYGGSEAVYAEIAASTDCAGLQVTFDRADANHGFAVEQGDRAEMDWTLGYMKASDARMREIGCYG